ncbi:MAG: tRNA uracil 4-sulfurtransferase ThiI [Spirochaetia bacterium]
MKVRYLIKIGEMSLKGDNKSLFEKRLKKNILSLLPDIKPQITIRDRRFYLDADESALDRVEEALSCTFGIVGFTRTTSSGKSMEELKQETAAELQRYVSKKYGPDEVEHIPEGEISFKIEPRRTDKSVPYSSYQIANEVGAHLNELFPFLRVDVKKPDLQICIEVREDVYIYIDEIKGLGGLPVGTAGKGLLMLSGGIDSPAAGYLMAKRGLSLNAVYFHTYPYTSDEALEKVKTLADTLAPYFIGTKLFVVPFTDFQLNIKEAAREEEVTLLMRAGMVKIAEKLAKNSYADALITGESLSQVASQTIESLRFTGSMTDLPVLRPLIGFDKEEIISLTRSIGTYETSILPYDDCCTIFSPSHPLVKPKLDKMQESWRRLDADDLIEKAVEETEEVYFPPAPGNLPSDNPASDKWPSYLENT